MGRDAYDFAPPAGTELAWTRVYRRYGRYAHLRGENGFGEIACPRYRWSDEESWLGTGSQAEYEQAASLPLCPWCFRVRAAARLGESADPSAPAERAGTGELTCP